MDPTTTDLLARARAWLAADPDPATREELRAILDREDLRELAERFDAPLAFGTAGLRGHLGAGPGRMNRAVVLRATAGLCAYLLRHVPDARARGLCIGFDGRHRSREFADDAAAVAAAFGLPALVFEEVAPTPLVAFACADQGAAAGIVVTASHNPPEDNGYKVYWGNAAQIIPPHDEGIAAEIDAAPPASEVPALPRAEAEARGLRRALGQDVLERYLEGLVRIPVHPEVPRDVVVAYTAMHGVGERFVRLAFARAGFERLHSVAEQADPDPDFPTVKFPNPEEKGAMDRVLALAARVGADVALANDPDADRLAVAVRARDGRYEALSGNDVGCLLAHYLLDQGAKDGARLVASSLVSSPLLESIAEAHGARFEPTLTGFKWIANRAMDLEREQGARFVFGFEEALGYTVGGLVRDKDGIGTALLVADLAAWCRSEGRTLLDEREAMWRRYGLAVSRQVSLTLAGLEGAARIGRMMGALRARPPEAIEGHAVLAVDDLQTGRRTRRDGEAAAPLAFPASDVIVLHPEGGQRLIARPSGTEPKIKLYVDVRVRVGADEPLADASARAAALADGLAAAFRAAVDAVP